MFFFHSDSKIMEMKEIASLFQISHHRDTLLFYVPAAKRMTGLGLLETVFQVRHFKSLFLRNNL